MGSWLRFAAVIAIAVPSVIAASSARAQHAHDHAAGAAASDVPVLVALSDSAEPRGFFMTFGPDGEVKDFGYKATQASGISMELGPVGVGYEREIEYEYGIMAALAS